MLTQEMVDRDFPAPKEWSFLTKVVYHAARGLEVPGANQAGVVNWGVCGLAYRDLLRRLEDRDGDGKGLKEQQDTAVPAFDVEHMSYEWQRGYYSALMGCGRAAIELSDAVLDTTTNIMYRRRHMIGPSNPKPKKLAKKFGPAPREENCVPAFAEPDDYFLKIMYTKGFSPKEKMDAAMAYAGWCDFKEMPDMADGVLRWALDTAVEGSDVNAPAIKIDHVVPTIPADAVVTDNILDATTALAVHRAQAGDTNSTLPSFLSILRARREAPHAVENTSPNAPHQRRDTKLKRTDIDVLNDQISSFWSLLQASKFPDPPPSGNDAYQHTPDSDAEEAVLMTYIGEILFSTDPSQRDAGLHWTKSAIDLAMKSYSSPLTSRAAKLKGVETLRVGSENRRKMVALLQADVSHASESRKNAAFWYRLIPGLLKSEKEIEEERKKWDKEKQEAREFEHMLMKGRVYDVGEAEAPVWGTAFLKEWILPRLAGTRTWEV